MISIFNQESQNQKFWVNLKLQIHTLTERPFELVMSELISISSERRDEVIKFHETLALNRTSGKGLQLIVKSGKLSLHFSLCLQRWDTGENDYLKYSTCKWTMKARMSEFQDLYFILHFTIKLHFGRTGKMISHVRASAALTEKWSSVSSTQPGCLLFQLQTI